MDRGPDRSKTGPRPDRANPGRNRSWTGPRQKSGTGYPCHLFFVGHDQPVLRGTTMSPILFSPPSFFVEYGQPMLRGTTVQPILFSPPSFFVEYGQPMLRGTTVQPILFGLPVQSIDPLVQTRVGPKTKKEKSLDRGPD